MINFRRVEQEKSYQHDALKNAFIPNYGVQLLSNIADKYNSKYDPYLLAKDVKLIKLTSTLLGPSNELKLGITPKYTLNISMKRGGWYMHLYKYNGEYISIEDRKKIFGDPNKSDLFTTETKHVVDMIGELRQWIIGLSL